MSYPKSIKSLIDSYKKLPGIGEKTAERLAIATMDFEKENCELFAKSIIDVKEKVIRCKQCNHLSEEELCEICKNESRDKSTICVVEEPKNVIMFEKIGTYNGLYHVLDGLISPIDGINPEDIKIYSLIERIKKENIKEIIIAVKPSIEGETTALYISKMLDGMKVTISKIAHGIPLGADMEYIDSLTLEMALDQRKNIKE